MTYHAVLVLSEDPPGSDVATRVRAQNAKHDEAIPGEAREFGPYSPEDAPAHAKGRYRYKKTEGKESLLDSIENSIPEIVSWYAIYYHECDHGLSANLRLSCEWRPERSKGAVPPEVTP